MSLFRSRVKYLGGVSICHFPHHYFIFFFTIPVYVLQFIYFRMMVRLEIGKKEIKKTSTILIVTLCFDLCNTLYHSNCDFRGWVLQPELDFTMFPVTLFSLNRIYYSGISDFSSGLKEKQTLLLEEINAYNWVDATMQRLMSIEMKQFTYLILIGTWVSFFGGIFIHFAEIGKYVIYLGTLIEVVGILKIGKIFSGRSFSEQYKG